MKTMQLYESTNRAGTLQRFTFAWKVKWLKFIISYEERGIWKYPKNQLNRVIFLNSYESLLYYL